MIDANQDFNAALSVEQKQALYALEIPAFGIIITSFTASQNLLATSGPGSNQGSVGWGNFLYGIGVWGS